VTYLPFIDGLRALAVLGVIAFHFGLLGASGGYVGVDVFFVLSGYLISGVIADAMRAKQFSLAHFYERRARRILPALFAAGLLSLCAALFLYVPRDFAAFAKSLAAAGAFGSNFVFAHDSGYFADAESVRPLLHTWSLAVEEQFYLLFPLLMMWAPARFLPPALCAVLALSFAANIFTLDRNPEAAFYLLHTRAWELMAGALARLCFPGARLPRALAEAGAAVGLGLILCCYFHYTRETPFPGWAALPPVLGAALVLRTCARRETLAGKILSARMPVLTGKISYGLYLYHWPLLVFARYFLGRAPDLAQVMLLTAATFALAALSYVFIESPVRAGRMLKSRKAVFSVSAAGLLLMIAAGLLGARGLPQRFSAEVLRYAEAADDKDMAPCVAQSLTPETACRVGADKKPDFLLWGDSHAFAILPAVADLARKRGRAGYFAAWSGCPPLLDAERADGHIRFSCAEVNAAAMQLIKDARIKTVLLAARWDVYEQGFEQGGAETARMPVIGYKGLRGRDAFENAWRDTVRALQHAGVKVWVLRQVPPQLEDVPSALARAALLRRDPETLKRPYGDVAARLAAQDGALAGVPGVSVIDPLPLFCPEKSACLIEADGHALYTDSHHLSRAGALWAEKMFQPFFK
jgi:peptidoglycan/LPS O-acetylase OafA/YrhL